MTVDAPEDAGAETGTVEPPDHGVVGGKLLEALVCPASGTRLVYDRERGELVSKAANLAYPIRSGIPIMLIDEARKLDD